VAEERVSGVHDALSVRTYRKAIELDHKLADPYYALGRALAQHGEFAAAREQIRHYLKLIPADHPKQETARWQLQECERLLIWERKLTAYLDTGERP